MVRSNDKLIKRLHPFTRKLPDSSVLFSLVFLLSIITGIISVGLTNYNLLNIRLEPVLAGGVLSGLLVIMIPALLTVLVIKLLKRVVRIKYLLFIALISAAVYALFIILASAIYHIVGNYSLSSVIVLVGDAGIYGWWFFVSKVLLGQKKKAMLFALTQPVLNVLIYIAASSLIFTFSAPLSVLLIKLSAGILVFLAISYIILYILDSPVKKNLGLDGINAFSQVVQSWLFDVDMIVPTPLGGVGGSFGVDTDIDVHTIVFKKHGASQIKAVMFAPYIHYGPVGSLGGSDFPYQLEKYANAEYKAPLFVMHCGVNEDSNPVSSSQLGMVKDALDRGIRNAKKTASRNLISLTESSYNYASVSLLTINKVNIATFTRAPSVMEDIAPASARLFKELLETGGNSTMILDAHNSRYESAPQDELLGITYNSKYMNEFVTAIKKLGKPVHASKRIRIGVSSVDIYDELGRPLDLAPGNLNLIVFIFNGYKSAMLNFNANNMMPSFRSDILAHIKKRYGIDAEVYTTDTHYINSLDRNASNVLGREANMNRLLPLIDRALNSAMDNVEEVDAYYRKDVINRFRVWGPNVRERAMGIISSVVGLARVLVPAIVAAGFIIAAWIISLV